MRLLSPNQRRQRDANERRTYPAREKLGNCGVCGEPAVGSYVPVGSRYAHEFCEQHRPATGTEITSYEESRHE